MTSEKMMFILDKDEDGYPPDDTETLWVENLGNYQYRIDNIPFYIRDISPNDIVEGDRSTGQLIFKNLIKKSEISVIRIVFFDNSKSDNVMAIMVSNGCRWEGSNISNLYSIEVPGSVDFKKLLDLLNEYVSVGDLDYEEASIRSF